MEGSSQENTETEEKKEKRRKMKYGTWYKRPNTGVIGVPEKEERVSTGQWWWCKK